MHTRNYDDSEIRFTGPDLNQDEIESAMSYLHNQIKEINSYSDKSLFFQNPQIFEQSATRPSGCTKRKIPDAPDRDNKNAGHHHDECSR